MKRELIVDCHSHIGKDYFWRESNIDEYLKIVEEQGINLSLLMPVPGQIIPSMPSKRYFIWSADDNGSIKFYSEDNSREIINPYKKVNDYAFEIISKHNTKNNLEFIPLIHPLLDTPEHIISLCEKYHPVALKIHGVACGIGPNDIPSNIINALKTVNLPIIVHTDYCANPQKPIEYMRLKNNPYDWAMFFIKNDLMGYLTHGCRNDLKTFELVNKYRNLVVGIGPELKISQEPHRWVNKSDKPYLEILKNELSMDKIMFDIDYSWNIDYNDNIDNKPLGRLSNYFTEEEKCKILSKNPKKFFNLNERGEK